MGEVEVQNPLNQVPPHKKPLPSSIPAIDFLEQIGTDENDEYSTLKKLQRHLEYASLCLLYV
jgi:26S proteasome regulatory subunit T3